MSQYRGFQARAIDKLVRMLCGSSTFQERAGRTEVELELAHVFTPAIQIDPDEGDVPPWPCVTMELPPGSETWTRIARGGKDQLRPNGTVAIAIWDKERYPGDQEQSWIDFVDFAGTVILDLKDLAGYDDNVSIESIEQIDAPVMIDDCQSAGNRFYIAQYLINYDGS